MLFYIRLWRAESDALYYATVLYYYCTVVRSDGRRAVRYTMLLYYTTTVLWYALTGGERGAHTKR